MGELHLEVLCRRLVEEMNVPVNVGAPRVSYRETVSATAERVSRIMPAVNIDQCNSLVNEQLRQLAAHDLISLEG